MCKVDFIMDGEDWSMPCDDLDEMFEDYEDWSYGDDDWYSDDETMYSDEDDEECWFIDSIGEDCVEVADVEGMTACWSYSDVNSCTGEESCYAYVTVDGEDMEGDCEELAEENDETWYGDD